jgi:hypothetical protein
MAEMIQAALARLQRTGVQDYVSGGHFEQLCRENGHVWRHRILSPAVTLQLFLLQVLHGNIAINALRQLSGLCFTAASYCQARTRLPLAALQRLLSEHCQRALQLAAGGSSSSAGRIYVTDSTGCSLPDTPALRERFGMPAPQREGVSYPMAMVLGLIDLASGLFVRAALFPIFVNDQRGATAVHQTLRAGDLLVGDRAFCSYVQIALLMARGIHCCLRLHPTRKVAACGGTVRWNKPYQCPPWLGLQQFNTLPFEMNVRIVHYRIDHKGYRSKEVFVVTTLLDATRWSDAWIARLYQQRWQIETCLAHLKTTMKMDVLKCKSVQGVLKELIIYLMIYNLVRLVMLRWARTCGCSVCRVSFIDALRLLSVRWLGLPGVAQLIINPDRTGRRQLRVRRRRPKHFALLNQPRHHQPDINYYRRKG